ncbi:MAG TPA: penicillin-binding transpeptidase domain-containing protein [Actinomycetota bacterium]|nr:penicillin-binding transpeptidase domain-containing protein [Actinomycetota bacterium]
MLALVAGACTSEAGDRPPSAAAAAESLFDAWSRGDAEAMLRTFARDVRDDWTVAELDEELDTLRDSDAVESYDVRRAGPVDGPDSVEPGALATVPYEVVVDLAEVDDAATLEGGVVMVFDGRADAWRVQWRDDVLWPGVTGEPAGVRAEHRFPPRAPILDRRGRKLARGTGLRRSYPYGALAGSTIGHVAPATRARAAELGSPYRRGNLVGASGLEAGLERRLAGTPGTVVAVVDERGRRLEVLGRTSPRAAKPVRTTLDVDVQRAAEAAYGGTTGGAVVVAPETGDLLAVVSSAQIDPNDYVGVAGVQPFNRATSGLYPPGSSMKVVTAAAALDTGVVTPSTRLRGPKEYRGVRNFESGSYPSLDFATAVRFSVNTAFARVAQRVGPERLTRYADAFGFNRPPDLPLDAARSSFPFPEDESDLMWGSIGQAQVLATPLQMASVVATIANDGVRVEPRVVLDDEPARRRAVTVRTARTLAKLMEGVVTGGTGQAARLAGVRVAGKTGTAEVSIDGKIKNHAWFVCFAPVGDAKVAVAVVSELGGIGGQVAAPLARDVLAGVLPHVK